MNKFAEHIKGQISKSAATVKELEELAKKYEEDLRGLGYTNMQVDPCFAYGQYGFYFNFMREDGKPGQKFTGLDTKNNTKLNLRNAYYDLINRKNWYLKRQTNTKNASAKKATVGYNAKPENLSEEMAIDLAEELDSAASLALEKAGLFWGGYSGEKERKERVEIAKEALKPLITNNFKKNIDGKFYDLVIEHLTDINSHIVVSAIEEIMKDKQASKCARITKKAFTYKDEKAALAKFLNIKEEDLTKNEEKFYFGLPKFTTKNGEEYRISASESVIRGAVAESLENLFDDLGFEEFIKILPYVGDLDRYFSVSESKFYDQVLEELRNVDEIEDPTEEQIEKRQQEIIDNYGSAEEFFIGFGDEYIKEMINYGVASFDFEKMAEDVIDQYGAGHELSSYDNSTEEVEYNGKTYYIFRQAKKTNKMTKKAESYQNNPHYHRGYYDGITAFKSGHYPDASVARHRLELRLRQEQREKYGEEAAMAYITGFDNGYSEAYSRKYYKEMQKNNSDKLANIIRKEIKWKS